MKILTCLLLLTAGLLVCPNLEARNDENVAIKAAKDAGCIERNESHLSVIIETLSLCFYSGSVRIAHIYVSPEHACFARPESCGERPMKPRADVFFGCGDDVDQVVCY